MKQIVLIGFMGAGKTTVGNLLAKSTGLECFDLDKLITKRINMPIADYFSLHGEEAFRKIETEVLKSVADMEGVFSTGGGVVLNKENREILKSLPKVIYLKSDLNELIKRVTEDTENVRPLVLDQSSEQIKEIYFPRVALYEESATHVVETTKRTPADIAAEILTLVGE